MLEFQMNIQLLIKNKTSKPLNLTQDIDYLKDIIKSLY